MIISAKCVIRSLAHIVVEVLRFDCLHLKGVYISRDVLVCPLTSLSFNKLPVKVCKLSVWGARWAATYDWNYIETDWLLIRAIGDDRVLLDLLKQICYFVKLTHNIWRRNVFLMKLRSSTVSFLLWVIILDPALLCCWDLAEPRFSLTRYVTSCRSDLLSLVLIPIKVGCSLYVRSLLHRTGSLPWDVLASFGLRLIAVDWDLISCSVANIVEPVVWLMICTHSWFTKFQCFEFWLRSCCNLCLWFLLVTLLCRVRFSMLCLLNAKVLLCRFTLLVFLCRRLLVLLSSWAGPVDPVT